MRTLLRAMVAAVVGLSLVAAAAAQTKVVGDWTGKLTIDLLPAQGTGGDAQALEMMKAMIAKVKFDLAIKADNTFKLTITPPEGEKELIEGVWALKENKLTLTPKKEGGKDVEKDDPKTFTIEKDGSFWHKFEEGPDGGNGKITFVRKVVKDGGGL